LFPSKDAADEPFTITVTSSPCPAGSFKVTIAPNGDMAIVYDQFPAPNDNSYGVNAVGWGTRGHTFGNLVGSDHAGFNLVNPAGGVVLDFNVDTITADATAPSGYRSLGVLGGEGGMLVGTSTGITADHSISRNVNNINIPGLFSAAHVQQTCLPVNGGVNVLVDSPKTVNTVDNYALTAASIAAGCSGWDFHNTFFVTIAKSKLTGLGFPSMPDALNFMSVDDVAKCVAGKWCMAPNADQLHNSPAKPCPCPTTGVTDPNPTISVVPGAVAGTTVITYTQSLAVNDNSYGTGSDPAWGSKGHTFSNLLGSDKLNVVINDGTVKYDFILDYISAGSRTAVATPSGYDTLGPFGGDGSCTTAPAPGCTAASGNFTAWSTTEAENLNLTPVAAPTAGCLGVGTWTTNSAQWPTPAVDCPTWNFVNSYTVTVKGTFTAAQVSFPLVHNSPAKPNTCPTTPGSSCQVSVTKKEVKDKQVKITIKNSASTDTFLTALNGLTWPASNGKLLEIKLDGDSIYKPAGGVSSVPAVLGVPPLVADQNKRKIGKGSSDTLILIFEKNASPLATAGYAGVAEFGPNCLLTILP
jgi:hypothetical protein